MDFPGRRCLTALAALGLLLPVAACSDDAPESPDTKAGDQSPAGSATSSAGKRTAVVTPAGRLSVSFADPVTRLEEDQTTDLTARNAPDGGVVRARRLVVRRRQDLRRDHPAVR